MQNYKQGRFLEIHSFENYFIVDKNQIHNFSSSSFDINALTSLKDCSHC